MGLFHEVSVEGVVLAELELLERSSELLSRQFSTATPKICAVVSSVGRAACPLFGSRAASSLIAFLISFIIRILLACVTSSGLWMCFVP